MRQQTLFTIEPDPWELDAKSTATVARVVLPTGPDRLFDYVVPHPLLDAHRSDRLVQPGRRLRVPFGKSNRVRIAYCVAVEQQPIGQRRLKAIDGVVDCEPLLSPLMLRLTRWIADVYLCNWGQVLDAVVPAGVRDQAGTRLTTVVVAPEGTIARLENLGLPEKQAAALRILATSENPMTPAQLARRAGCTIGPINALRKKGLVEEQRERFLTPPQEELAIARTQPPALNHHQQAALEAILESLRAGRHETFLMHGITGSGKTEVYMAAIEEAITYGRQAIVLVPEISLTPQTVHWFRTRFGDVAVLHSHQSDALRHWHWRRIARGQVPVVIGARSAVFAPTPNLGLLVVDEEHEASFKQDSTPRYHARDVARQRAIDEQVPLVLGSATPSLESWQRGQSRVYRLLSLPERIQGRPLPRARIVDLRQKDGPRGGRAIGRVLHQEMETALSTGGQVLLLLNRRGFSTHIQCPACGYAVHCPDCDLSLTFHRREEHLRCHHCNRIESPPTVCPECRFQGIRFGGLGTQKLEDEVRRRFAKYDVARMDTDSTRRAGSHEKILDRFRRGEAHILLGTQMIAKGLDFPNVTLVGVINADSALHFPDFRASERTFQLVTQVAGRSGRGQHEGRVVIQTFSPDNAIIRAAAEHDYLRFAATELAHREALGYPPFGQLARIVVRGRDSQKAAEFAALLADRLTATQAAVDCILRVLGPAPAPLARLRGQFRYHMHVHAAEHHPLTSTLSSAIATLKPPDGVQFAVDVDPQDML